jgi:hypothetical protein
LDDSKEQTLMRKSIAAGTGAIAVLTAIGGAVAPAQAAETAYPTAPYNAPYGATYSKGTITFYNRSVQVKGTLRALSSSGCRQTIVKTYSGSRELARQYGPSSCNGVVPVDMPVSADTGGGATSVWVGLYYQNVDGTIDLLAWDSVPRP